MLEKLKIIIVDDHEFFRKGVALTIGRLKYAEVVGEACNGIELLALLDNISVDIVLMDIKMPYMDGIEATKMALEKYPNLKIVALSMFGEEEYLESMLEAGVHGFFLKNIGKEGLDRALQVIAQDNQYFSEELMPFFTNKYLKKNKHNSNDSLTKRELQILRLVAEGLTNKSIAEKLFISQRTVTNHRANLNLKTGSKNTATLISYALKNNLIEY